MTIAARLAEENPISVRSVTLDGDGLPLSGLFAEPEGQPRALVLALHGGGMTSAYFHGRAHPDLSLLDLGAHLGYAVLALDRPGYVASRPFVPDGQTLLAQVESIYTAVGHHEADHDIGAGVFVVAHSYGLKVALHMAADGRGASLLGIDGSGVIWQYEPALDPANGERSNERRRPRDLFWGSEDLYPPGTFATGNRPSAPVPLAEQREAPLWPQLLPPLAARVRVPYRFTVAEHELWWLHDDQALAQYGDLFAASPRLIVRRQPAAGHNISLGRAARAYHLGALAFAEECIQRAAGSPRTDDGSPT